MPEFKTIRVGESAKAVAFDPYEYNYVGRESSGPVEVTTAAIGEEDGQADFIYRGSQGIADLTPSLPPPNQSYTAPSTGTTVPSRPEGFGVPALISWTPSQDDPNLGVVTLYDIYGNQTQNSNEKLFTKDQVGTYFGDDTLSRFKLVAPIADSKTGKRADASASDIQPLDFQDFLSFGVQGPPEQQPPYIPPVEDFTPVVPPPTVYDPGTDLYIPNIQRPDPFVPDQPLDDFVGPIQPGEQIPTGPRVDYRPDVGLPVTTFATGEEEGYGNPPPTAPTTMAMGEEDGYGNPPPTAPTTMAMGEEDGGMQDPFRRTYGNNPVPPTYTPPGQPRTYQPSNFQGTGTPTTYNPPSMVLPELIDGSQAMNPLRQGIGAIFDRAKQLQGQTNYINPFKRYV